MNKVSEYIPSLWQVAREYAGIAEAGGVKNVVCSLAEGFVRQGISSTVFLPLYGCVTNRFIPELSLKLIGQAVILTGDNRWPISFYESFFHSVRIIFIDSSVFREKSAVYTYTSEDEQHIHGIARGQGHVDAVVMNIILQKSVIEYVRITSEVPDGLLCQDAHTALLPAFIACDSDLLKRFVNTVNIVIIHNAGPGYHQEIHDIGIAEKLTGLPFAILEKGLLNGVVEPFLIASLFARLITVSPWYADELMNPVYPHSGGLSAEFNRRGIVIEGITNGIDYNKYDPVDISKSLLPVPFNPISGDFAGKKQCIEVFLSIIGSRSCGNDIEQFGYLDGESDSVYFSYHGRIAVQKGLDILYAAARRVLNVSAESRFIIIGQGDPSLEGLHMVLAEEFPGRYVFLRGYERSLARLSVAASDFLVLPSRFEPCGLEDFIGQIYGTIPVAHAVGGLNKILDGKTGFLYSENGKESNLYDSVGALDTVLENLVSLLYHLISVKLISPEKLDYIRIQAAQYVRDEYVWDTVIKKKYLSLFNLDKFQTAD